MDSYVNNNDVGISPIANRNLPPFMAAPPGWHSEILHNPYENAISNDRSTIQLHQTNFNSENEYLASQTSIVPSTEINFHNNYVDTIDTTNYVHSYEQQRQPPLVIRKQLPNNSITYKQNVSVRYLRPPTPPPPGPLIIREVRPPAPRPLSPIKIRQQPPPPPTPPPIVLRERPPPVPLAAPPQVVEKILPTPPAPPRRIVVERFAAPPPKPADVIIERWLPYNKPQQRRVLVERAPPIPVVPQEPNLLVLYDSPERRVHREFIDRGITHEDPESYLQRYGAELNLSYGSSQYGGLINEASRAVPPPVSSTVRYDTGDYSYLDRYRRASSPYWTHDRDRLHSYSSVPRSYSYHYDEPYWHSSYNYPRQYYDSYRSMVDITPSWRQYCDSSSYYPSSDNTIRVHSEGEFQDVLSNLTAGRYRSRHYGY